LGFVVFKMSEVNVGRGMLTAALVVALAVAPSTVWAADSYRWLRVTIDTPWAIFIFLLPMVLVPIVLLAILQWRFAFAGSNKVGVTAPDVASQEFIERASSDKV